MYNYASGFPATNFSFNILKSENPAGTVIRDFYGIGKKNLYGIERTRQYSLKSFIFSFDNVPLLVNFNKWK